MSAAEKRKKNVELIGLDIDDEYKDNFDKFFIEPIKPTPSACFNDTLNECLIDNIEDIMMLL